MAPKNDSAEIRLVNYGKGCAVFDSQMELNPVFKSLGGKGNRNLTHPETDEKCFGWVFGSNRKPLLKEFLTTQDVEGFFTAHPEITRWTPPTAAERTERPQQHKAGPVAQASVPAQKNVSKTINRIFNVGTMFPGPVVAYLVNKVLEGKAPNRGAAVVSIVKLSGGTTYTIYEGAEDNIDSAIELKTFQAKKAKVGIVVHRIDANLVAIVSEEPVVETEPVKIEKPTEEDSDEEEEPKKAKKSKGKKPAKKAKKVESDDENKSDEE